MSPDRSKPTRRTGSTAARIAVNGTFLDDVRIALPKRPNTLSYLGFPAHKFDALAKGDCVVLSAQACVVVQLYFDGTLPTDRSLPVRLQVGNDDLGDFHLERVESADEPTYGNPVLLHLRRHKESEG